jgi:hypothetical protein
MTPPLSNTRSKTLKSSTSVGRSSSKSILPPSLVRQLLLHYNPTVRISQDGLIAASAFLHVFVTEAIHRASVEAECEADSAAAVGEEGDRKESQIIVRGDHIGKIAAELLMDFS